MRATPGRMSTTQKIAVGLLFGGAPFNYTDWLTENFPNADRWDHQDLSGSSVLEASYSTALALGRELIPNWNFATWAGDDPVNWTVVNEDANNIVSEDANGASFVSDGSAVLQLKTDAIIIDVGKTYNIEIVLFSYASGTLELRDAASNVILTLNGPGPFTALNYTALATGVLTLRRLNACGMVLRSVSAKQTGILASSTYPGLEEFAQGGAGWWDVVNWTGGSGATLTNPSVGVLQNSCAIADAASIATQALVGIPGLRYVITGEAAGDGVNGSPKITDSTAAVTIWPGTTSALFQEIKVEFTMTGSGSIALFTNGDNATTDITQWRNLSMKLVNPMNGTTVVSTVGVPTNFGSLGLSVVDDGAASFSDIHSAEINSKFNPAAGFLNVWVANNDWALNNRVVVALIADISNRVIMQSVVADNILRVEYKAGNTAEQIDISVSAADYVMATITWEKPGNLIAYLNGVSVGTPQAIAGTWVGNLASATTVIGAFSTTPTSVFDGSRTRLMLGYSLPVPTAAQVLSLYNQGRR